MPSLELSSTDIKTGNLEYLETNHKKIWNSESVPINKIKIGGVCHTIHITCWCSEKGFAFVAWNMQPLLSPGRAIFPDRLAEINKFEISNRINRTNRTNREHPFL